MKVLVTGGAGFIGSHLSERLSARGHQVVVADNLLLGRRSHLAALEGRDGFRFVELDVADEDAVDELFGREAFDGVFHMAANSDIAKSHADPSTDFTNTLRTTWSVLEAMRRHDVQQIVFASTSAIYGEAPGRIREDHGPLMPISHYGACKLASEALISSYGENYGIQGWITRFPNVVGDRLTHGAVYDFARKLKSTPDRLEVLGDGTQVKPYLHVFDLVDAILITWDKSTDQTNFFNVGGTTRCTVRRMAEIVVAESGLNARIDYTGGDRGWVGDVPSVEYDTDKIRALGWEPKLDSESAVARGSALDVRERRMKVVILCGGKGTRLGLTDKPKPMVLVAGVPLLERLVNVSKAAGLIEFIFLNGHLAEVIESHFGDGAAFGVAITHIRESEPLGTAGALREARTLLTEPFMVIYGDILIDVDLAHFAAFHAANGGVGSLFVHPNDHPHDSDLVEADANGRITRFLSKPHADGAILPNLVSGALYVLDPAAIDHVPAAGQSDWGRDVFPAIVAAGGTLYAYRSLEYAKDVGTPDRLARGEADIASGKLARLSRRQPKPALFLDRDGVVNIERNGVHRPEDMHLTAGAGAAIRRVNKAGMPAIVITNQPDIAKGFMTFSDLAHVHDALDTALAADGAYLDDLYFCPHHPEAGHAGEVPALKIMCDCRKPAPGMLLTAARDHRLDLTRSWLIGDRYADIAAAHAAGAKGILIRTGHAGDDIDRHDVAPDHVADDLTAAINFILGTTA